MEWINVKDGLPESDVIVLITDLVSVSLGHVVRYKSGLAVFYSNSIRELESIPGKRVTHWMPLPKPPTIK